MPKTYYFLAAEAEDHMAASKWGWEVSNPASCCVVAMGTICAQAVHRGQDLAWSPWVKHYLYNAVRCLSWAGGWGKKIPRDCLIGHQQRPPWVLLWHVTRVTCTRVRKGGESTRQRTDKKLWLCPPWVWSKVCFHHTVIDLRVGMSPFFQWELDSQLPFFQMLAWA